jgi:hypothetical protein
MVTGVVVAGSRALERTALEVTGEIGTQAVETPSATATASTRAPRQLPGASWQSVPVRRLALLAAQIGVMASLNLPSMTRPP